MTSKKKSAIKDLPVFRKASMKDAKGIHSLVNTFARKDDMLPRSLNEIYENIRDFYVCTNSRSIIGTAALHLLWDDLAEIRSVSVSKNYQRRGIGKKLIRNCLNEAKKLGVSKVFALTYRAGYFKELGFNEIDKNSLPHKIWGECLKCHKFPDCDESAVLKKL
ncbi:MAG: N-acetyltransferase [Nitrospiraceae bacterium]|nr:MAG: N-acetyltransferase [Nitrospiraceae bacterium]